MNDFKIEYNRDIKNIVTWGRSGKWIKLINDFISDPRKETCVISFIDIKEARTAYTGLRNVARRVAPAYSIEVAQRRSQVIIWKVKGDFE